MRRNILFFLCCLILAVGLSACGNDESAQQQSSAKDAISLTYSNFFPPAHVQSQLAEEWCKEVEKRTGGRVKVFYYPGQTLTKAKQCYDGVEEGLSDIGLSALAYSRGRFPAMAAVDLPLGYTSGVQATKAANDLYAKFRPAEFDDTQVMYFHAHGPGLLHTTQKPIRTMGDLAGLKLRATGNSAKVAEYLGATPVGMPMPDSYQALQKGVVDGSLYPVESNKGWRLAEVVKFRTNSYSVAYTTAFFVVMNKAKWNGLPDDIKAIINEINGEWAAKHGEAWDESDKAGEAFFLEKGGEIIPLDEAESLRWKTAVAPVITEYIKETAAAGLDGKAYVDFLNAELGN